MQTTKTICDSLISGTCDRMAAAAVTAKLIAAAEPPVRPEDSRIVRHADSCAADFAAGNRGAVGAAVAQFAAVARSEGTPSLAETPIVRRADTLAAEFEASRHSGRA
jgi:hypothetical protein